MTQYIPKAAVVAKIEKRKNENLECETKVGQGYFSARAMEDIDILSCLDTIEVKDPYEQCIQYASIEHGIKAHAEVYSFNIESELFPQLTKEQQVLWRKEIEQAVISGGEQGIELARDKRYKENLEADLEKEISEYFAEHPDEFFSDKYKLIARYFFKLGLKSA